MQCTKLFDNNHDNMAQGASKCICLLLAVLELVDDENFPWSRNIFAHVSMIASSRRSHVPHLHGYLELTDQHNVWDFRQHFCVSAETFDVLVGQLLNLPGFSAPHNGRRRPVVSVRKQLRHTLWYLGTQESYLSMADCFSLSMSTCHDIVWRIIFVLCRD